MFRHGWLIAVFPVAASFAAVDYPVRVDAPSPCESLGTISPAHGWTGDIQPDDRYCLHVPLEEGALARLHLAVDSGIVDVELWPPGSEDPLLVLGVGYGLDPPRALTWKAEVGGSYRVLLRGVGPERDGRGYPAWGARVTAEEIVPPEVQAATDARLAADPRTRWLAEHAIPLRSISPGDDDHTDLAALREILGKARLVHLGVGDPGAGSDFLALTPAYPVGQPDRSYSGVLIDMDRDGDLDLVVSNDNPDAKLVHLNDGNGRFTTGWMYGRPEWSTRHIRVADLNNDSLPDVVLANRSGGDSGVSYICFGVDGGRFETEGVGFARGSATTITPADFDSDGAVDLAVPHRDGGQSFIYRNDERR